MSSVASARLIDACQTLNEADRALLNLWIHRGLDDDTLADLIATKPIVIARRRDDIVTHLSNELGLSPETVRDAVEALAQSDPEPTMGETAEPETAAAPARPTRRRLWFGALVLAAAVALVIVLLGSGGHTHPSRSSPQGSKTASSPSGAGPQAIVPRARQSLAAVTGGPTGVSATAALLGRAPRVRIVLTEAGLPPHAGAYYELWLYNSIIDSVPLGRVGGSTNPLTVALPEDYRRFRWLDISLQAADSVHHSGISILRGLTPQ